MCGRYVLRTSTPDLARMLGVEDPPETIPSYNIAPTQDAPVCRAAGAGRRELVPMRWGLVPHWMKDPKHGARMINARAETVAEKPAFRAAFRHRRCLVPSDGFFEWQARPGGKQPHFIHRRDDAPFSFAGLWERWGADDALLTFAIVTTEATPALAGVHHRMPVVIPPTEYGEWLDPERTDADAVRPLLAGAPDGDLQAVPVSTFVNSPRNNDPRCIEPIAAGDGA